MKWTGKESNSEGKSSIGYIKKKTFVSRDQTLWKKLIVALVRPNLEYAAPVWNPYMKKDIDIVEKVFKKATKVPSELKELSYEERLRQLELTSFSERIALRFFHWLCRATEEKASGLY